MALVVLLRGVNVGGHRRFKPAQFVMLFRHLDAVNVGAAGTFVIKKPVSRTQLRNEIASKLPFEADITICRGREVVKLLDHPAFALVPERSGIVRFVSILPSLPRSPPQLPITIPARGAWQLKVLARKGRFVLGVYLRHMKVIGHLSKLDNLFGMPATTRSWTTLTAIARAIDEKE